MGKLTDKNILITGGNSGDWAGRSAGIRQRGARESPSAA